MSDVLKEMGIEAGVKVRVKKNFENIIPKYNPSVTTGMIKMAGKILIVDGVNEHCASVNRCNFAPEWLEVVKQPDKTSNYSFLGSPDIERICKETLECGQFAFVLVSKDSAVMGLYCPTYEGSLFCGFTLVNIHKSQVPLSIKKAKKYSIDLKEGCEAMDASKMLADDVAKSLKQMKAERKANKNKVICF